MAQQTGHAVRVGLATDESDGGMNAGLGSQMLARAEADLQPHGARRRVIEGPGLDGPVGRRIDGDSGQQRVEQG